MSEAIEAALAKQDFTKAAELIRALDPTDPKTLLCWGQFREATQEWEMAEEIYRSLLRDTLNPKVILAARHGLERLRSQKAQDRKAAIAEATSAPEKAELGVLILEALPPDAKKEAALAMAQIMNIDPYSARVLLPSRGMRLYRSGPLGELEFYGQQLKDKGIPVLWRSLAELQRISIYTVAYFQSVEPTVSAMVWQNNPDELRPFNFAWADVSQRIEAQLPIFEAVLDRDVRGKLQRKEKTQDYAQFCDLHLPKRNCILRLYDAAYQFNHGISLQSAQPEQHLNNSTSWANWRHLSQVLQQHLPQQTVWTDFEPFAETALDHPDLLEKLPAHIDLFRREDSNWDPAFQLYSTVLFLH
ncbi:MAG TPA: hypothetical protein V6D19_07915 [Stenomitos sp.]